MNAPARIARSPNSVSSITVPISAATIVMSRMSKFLMWLISCATTACSSSRVSCESSPSVTAMLAFDGSVPVANALGSGSGITYSAGLGTPAAMAISSTTFAYCRYWFAGVVDRHRAGGTEHGLRPGRQA